ncbi:sensor domain-containing protein [Solimonas sp. C16B3]|uniref:Sensor domain-containing protein n=1 Tax=Solimonas marina TaxID=2714601 RepID=A0A970B4V1_9GAMM|nr:sensor domain-containing protein [Solimonas marina]
MTRWRHGAARARVCFSYIAQEHQIPHSLPIAVALAQDHPDVDVHIAGAPRQLSFARSMLDARGIQAPLQFDELRQPLEGRLGVPCKKRQLRLNALYFSGFDAVVVPERTSTYLRRLPLPRTRLIGTEHGAGDREVTYAPEVARYDFLMLAGRKQARRLLELGYAREERLATGVYAKFDWVGAQTPARRRFNNGRPTVLYNPHFESALSSWATHGQAVLDYFARSTRYNLIFAPHLRLFDPPSAAKYRPFERYRGLSHLHIDLGSASCVDMHYTADADLYLGDVSSQVVEFLMRPRPCVFINAHGHDWRDDPHYRFWTLGPVIESADALDTALASAFATHAQMVDAQLAYVADSFGEVRVGHSATRGATAITSFLHREADAEAQQRSAGLATSTAP